MTKDIEMKLDQMTEMKRRKSEYIALKNKCKKMQESKIMTLGWEECNKLHGDSMQWMDIDEDAKKVVAIALTEFCSRKMSECEHELEKLLEELKSLRS